MSVLKIVLWCCFAVVVGAALRVSIQDSTGTPSQPDVQLVTFPDQNVECYIYRDQMQFFQYTDDGIETVSPLAYDNARHIDGVMS